MPKRTNEFQELVTSFHRMFAPEGAVITPSAIIKAENGHEREIDILIEFHEPVYSFKVAVEAKDLKRNLDVTHVEGYIGKYNSPGGISVNKVLIVGKGFSKAADKRAKECGFQLHTAKTVENIDLATIFNNPPNQNQNDNNKQHSPGQFSCRWFDRENAEIPECVLQQGKLCHVRKDIHPRHLACCINRTILRFISDVEEGRKQRQGVMIGGRLRIEFNHVQLVTSDKSIEIRYLHVEVQPSMVIPPMNSKEFVVVSEEFGEKSIVVSRFKNDFTQFKITYPKETGVDLPQKMQIDELQFSPQYLQGNAKIGGNLKQLEQSSLKETNDPKN